MAYNSVSADMHAAEDEALMELVLTGEEAATT
jgi:hypothetical protein